jgi:pilus assembly protein CpaC
VQEKQIRLILVVSVCMTLSLVQAAEGSDVLSTINIVTGMSRLLDVNTVSRVAVGDPDIADVVVVSDREILINGICAGITSLHIWDQHGLRESVIRVHDDVAYVEDEIQRAIGFPDVSVRVVRGVVILDGEVRDQSWVKRAESIASAYSDEVVNLLRVYDPLQVLFQVKVVEVSNRVSDRLGVRWGSFMRGVFLPEVVQFGETNIGMPVSRLQMLGAELNFMVQEGEARILAEPEVLCMSGEEASFLVGGEIPFTVSSGSGNSEIQWKPYGVQLNVYAEVDALRNILLRIEPEVSSLDWQNGITTQTGILPAIKTRQMKTVVTVEDRTPIVLGGLIQNEVSKQVHKLPILGDIPIIGELFRSEEFQNHETELVIIVIPNIVTGKLNTVDAK